MNYKERVDALKSLGFQVYAETIYKRETGREAVDLVQSVHLPFSAQEWCDIFQSNGAYNMVDFEPQIQLILDDVFKHDGDIQGHQLREIAEMMQEWDYTPEEEDLQGVPYISFKAPLEGLSVLTDYAKQNWKDLQPIDKVSFAWHMVDGIYAMDNDQKIPKQVFENSLDQALRVIHTSSFMISMRDMFPSESASQVKANDLMDGYRLIPALRMVLDKVHEVMPEPVTGYALIDVETGPEAVASNGQGFCFYETRKDAEDFYKLMLQTIKTYKDDEAFRPKYLTLGIRQVRVSVEKGFEFLDQAPGPIL